MTPWLTIIGCPAAGVPDLPTSALARLAGTGAIIGPSRLLDSLPNGFPADRRPWPSGIEAMLALVQSRKGEPTMILASGDPSWFGIAATLAACLDPGEFDIHPAPSAFQLAAARLRWPLQSVATLSLHGRPAEALVPHLQPRNRIIALTADRATLSIVLVLLRQHGYAQSQVTVFENMGAADEKAWSGTAADLDPLPVGPFYTLAIDCVAEPGTPHHPAIPGLPDSAFTHDGQLTKREVRAATLSRLGPTPGALLWDVGAGCGSIAIEWMRAARDARAIAFEREPARTALIAGNARHLGVPSLMIEQGNAIDRLAAAEKPDAIFLGGAVADDALFAACWQHLPAGGRFVANAVTLDAEQALLRRQAELGGDLVRIAVSVLDGVGGHSVLRPRLPVTQWSIVK